MHLKGASDGYGLNTLPMRNNNLDDDGHPMLELHTDEKMQLRNANGQIGRSRKICRENSLRGPRLARNSCREMKPDVIFRISTPFPRSFREPIAGGFLKMFTQGL